MRFGLEAIARFFQHRLSELKRIASGSRGDFELSDVQNEAWLEAHKLGETRGFPVDFMDRADQNHLLARLYNRLVKYSDKTVRFAVKLDTDWDREESTAYGAVLARFLTAPVASDPQASLPDPHDSLKMSDAVQNSYSEAAAYVLLLMRFEWDARDLSGYLHIALNTLRLKLRVAGQKVSVQPSLFDRIEKVREDFEPALWLKRSSIQTVHLEGSQRAWMF